eukprot:9371904-Lingulodinium_polyedra.AAC.1
MRLVLHTFVHASSGSRPLWDMSFWVQAGSQATCSNSVWMALSRLQAPSAIGHGPFNNSIRSHVPHLSL